LKSGKNYFEESLRGELQQLPHYDLGVFEAESLD